MSLLYFKLLLLIPSLLIYWACFVVYQLTKNKKQKLMIYAALSLLVILSTIWAIFVIIFGYNS